MNDKCVALDSGNESQSKKIDRQNGRKQNYMSCVVVLSLTVVLT